MIPTCYLRQVPTYKYTPAYHAMKGEYEKRELTGYRLQQWWTDEANEMRRVPGLRGEWRYVEIIEGNV